MSDTTAAPAVPQAPAPAAAAAAPTPAQPPAQAKPAAAAQPPSSPSLLTDAPPAADSPKPDAAPDGRPSEPIKYADFKLPEGVGADDPILVAFTESAAAQRLPQEQAQAMIDALGPKVAELLAAPQQEWQRLNNDWQQAVKADPEIGGANFDAMRATVAKVLDDPAFADPGLRQALDMTGAGNNPAVIRTLYRLAKAVTEGGPVRPGAPAAPRKSAAQTLYPSEAR